MTEYSDQVADGELDDIDFDRAVDENKKLSLEEKRQKAKKQLLESLYSGIADTIIEKVALALKLSKKARNSDVELYWEFWRTYESERMANVNSVTYEETFKISRPMSLSRARAKIQNEYQLFQADELIKKRRGVLEEERKNEMLEATPVYPVFSVLADESGKTMGDYLIIGSIWFYDARAETATISKLRKWNSENKIDYEFHFSDLSPSRLESYKAYFSEFLSGNTSVCFKAAIVKKSGLQNMQNALNHLTLFLLNQGVLHEDSTGAAQLPRRLEFWADSENVEADNLRLSAIKSLLQKQKFPSGRILKCDSFEAIESKGNLLIQIADIFSASINRIINISSDKKNAKDALAEHVLQSLGMVEYGSGAIDFENNHVKIFTLSNIQDGDILTS